MANDATFRGQFDGPAILLFVGVEVALTDGSWLRLLAGSGEFTVDGKVFVGDDPTYGVLAALDPVTDGMGDQAPSLRVTINPKTVDAASTLAAQDMQGQSVLLWMAALNPATGANIDEPVLIFSGDVDQGVLVVGKGTRTVALDCVSVWERLFDNDDAVRLTNAYHQNAWPGETGFEFVTDVTRQLPWGQDLPVPAVVKDSLYVRPPT
jgi:hypothetical protein